MHPTDPTQLRPLPTPRRRLRNATPPPSARVFAPSATGAVPHQAPHGDSAHDFLVLGALPELCFESVAK